MTVGTIESLCVNHLVLGVVGRISISTPILAQLLMHSLHLLGQKQ